MPALLLAADVGATKTDLALFSPEAGPGAPLAASTVPTAGYPSLESLAQEFLSQAGTAVDGAIFAVAGPVIAGRVTATISHLPWEVARSRLQEALGLPSVSLLNDLEATALAIPHLGAGEFHTLSAGEPDPGGAIGLLAPGTGLGEAFLLPDKAGYRACSAEGGHANFAPTGPLEAELLRYVQRSYGHVSYELVCSGLGIPRIYAFLKQLGHADEPEWLSRRLGAAEDATPVIVEAALAQPASCPLCRDTLDLFIAILGAKAGNLALQVFATGGVYLGGGIPPRILPLLKQEKDRFLHAFCNKGLMTEMMVRVPVHIITHPHAALLGLFHLSMG